jgi:hypothetical protein
MPPCGQGFCRRQDFCTFLWLKLLNMLDHELDFFI